MPIPIAQAKDDEQGSFIVERIREALEAHRRGGLAADSAVLRRGQRDVREWVSALRALGAGANADMRTAPLPPERLFRVVEDPAASSADRAAAAVALGSDLDDTGRARLRTAAAAVAGPRLRAALETAAIQAEQAALEAALAEVEQEEATARAPGGREPPEADRRSAAPGTSPRRAVLPPAMTDRTWEIDAPSLAITLRWGDAALHTAHLAPPRSFFLGGPPPTARSRGRGGPRPRPLLLAERGALYLVLLPAMDPDGVIAAPVAPLARSPISRAPAWPRRRSMSPAPSSSSSSPA